MLENSLSVNARIATRVREMRAAAGLSLDALASTCGVSRSMISLIERGESSPTAVVLEKLATGLGVMLADLFSPPAATPNPVARRAEQPSWTDPGSGYTRRNVSSSGTSNPIQIVEVHFPPGATVAFETGPREARVYQQIWLLEGAMEVALGAGRHQLSAGDCLAMQLDRPTVFHNPTREPARYAVVIASIPLSLR
ncbi:XRE family transcriptional regulator [Gemmata sp. JC673]|uniref:XRE family transcriptional regulator n=1 Tax=Gemmata algarum TaxID=2975278 RepID=A0ABU5EWE2_9BACT|nr:XRE family transcriptional regulator [Gemmata algarum]MDY3558795.1 XRE family transcriptional regulator [Gemmata algarum]